MNRGDIVKVYEDPVTMQKLEGEAKLVEEYRPDCGDGLSMWVVRFLKTRRYSEQTALRTINERAEKS